MKLLSGRRRAWIPTLVFAVLFMTGRAASPADPGGQAGPDIVAVSILHKGRAVLIATPGIPSGGRLWRFRSFDTSALPQPIQRAWLSASGTKLFLQPTASAGVVIDLTRQQRVGAALQYIDPARDVASGGVATGQAHYLPSQRFVSARDGTVSVIDDKCAAVPEYSAFSAVDGAVSDDGAVLIVRSDRTMAICGQGMSSGSTCRDLPARVDPAAVRISARSVPPRGDTPAGRFLLVTGTEEQAYVIDPEQKPSEGPAMSATEAALRACLTLHQMSMSDRQIKALADALPKEAAQTAAASRQPVGGWQVFRVIPDEELYAPILEFNRRETVFPTGFGILANLREQMSEGQQTPSDEALYDRYLRFEPLERKKLCTLHFRTHSTPGSWVIEYWIYYPFDVGGLGAHLHDPEHFFVEVDKLGGSVRRVIGAAHGYMAGNNIYFVDNIGALPIDLPLFAIPELGKHATAADVDRDGVFTPGVDENEYGERSKIWGVRDVIGTINNQFLAYDTTMSVPRRPADCLAPVSLTTRFPPVEGYDAAHPWCRIEPVPDEGPPPPACKQPTIECAKGNVISHPDYRDLSTVLKSWFFPDSFLRLTYGYGPTVTRHTVALGYAVDLDRLRGLRKIMPLPGRVGAEVFGWHQDTAYLDKNDHDACIGECDKDAGWGWGLRYEQFIMNIFGIYGSVRFYDPLPKTLKDVWISFGPTIEMTLFNHSNVNIQGGVAFQGRGAARFDMRLSVGVWKPKTKMVGMKAGSDRQ